MLHSLTCTDKSCALSRNDGSSILQNVKHFIQHDTPRPAILLVFSRTSRSNLFFHWSRRHVRQKYSVSSHTRCRKRWDKPGGCTSALLSWSVLAFLACVAAGPRTRLNNLNIEGLERLRRRLRIFRVTLYWTTALLYHPAAGYRPVYSWY